MMFETTFKLNPDLAPAPVGKPLEDIAPLHPVTRWGDNGDNSLKGGFADDSLFGGGGDDELEGLWGNDIIYGGEGADYIAGDSGNDRLFGNDDGSDADVLVGGSGNDELHAGGRDLAIGDSGDDIIYLSGVLSSGYGGYGDDIIVRDIDGGRSTLNGGHGDDTLIAHGRGALDVRNSNLSNSLQGGEGDDMLIMIGGFAEADGGIGNDTFIFGSIEDGGHFIATDRDGANDFHFTNSSQEEIVVSVTGFDADDSLHFHDIFGDDVTTLDSNGDGVITAADDHVFSSSGFSVVIATDTLYLRVENQDFATSGADWLSADQVEIA